MPYLSQDSGEIPADKIEERIEREYNDRFYKGYMKGKKEAKEDVKDRCVGTVEIKKNRDVTDPFCMGYEVGYLRELLWILTEGKIT
jgi:hypothetical protein